MTELVLSSLCVFAAYIAYALRTVGIPTSVSETYYLLRICGKPAWLFQAAMMACALLLLPAWLELSSPHLQFLAFLCCGSLIFVGAAPHVSPGAGREGTFLRQSDSGCRRIGVARRLRAGSCAAGHRSCGRSVGQAIRLRAVLGRAGSVCQRVCRGGGGSYECLTRGTDTNI